MGCQYGWWQVIRMLSGQAAGNNDLVGITTTPGPLLQPPKLVELLANGCAVVRGVPFNGQAPEPIPADAWPHIHLQLSTKPPAAIGSERLGIVAALKSPVDGVGRTAGGGWHHLAIDESELEKLRATAVRLYPPLPRLPSVPETASSQPPLPVGEAAKQIAQLNVGTTVDHLLARLLKTIELGNLASSEIGETGSPVVLPAELAYWAKKRGLACPADWLLLVDGEVIDENDNPELGVYITIFEAASWIAHRSSKPTEDLKTAVEQLLVPKLQSGELYATGRENCSGPHEVIPRKRWIGTELTYPPGDSRLWIAEERYRPPLYDHVVVERSEVERIWPANTPEGNADPCMTQASGMPTPMPSVEGRCLLYLIKAMRSEPEHRPKEWFHAECKKRYGQGLTDRGFERSWNRATKHPGLGYRSRPGRKSKAKSNRDVISPKS